MVSCACRRLRGASVASTASDAGCANEATVPKANRADPRAQRSRRDDFILRKTHAAAIVASPSLAYLASESQESFAGFVQRLRTLREIQAHVAMLARREETRARHWCDADFLRHP